MDAIIVSYDELSGKAASFLSVLELSLAAIDIFGVRDREVDTRLGYIIDH